MEKNEDAAGTLHRQSQRKRAVDVFLSDMLDAHAYQINGISLYFTFA
ncbi:MAG: hypothetical protein VB106_08465 [Clostridiaceae bacterium]|jgi:hypothetical protein|nr:hypothetical protein [Clostridiaceae bacterium]